MVVYLSHGGLKANMTGSFGAIVTVLAVYGLFSLRKRHPVHMPRYLLLQCAASAGLALCGLFYASVSFGLAAVVVVLAVLSMTSVWLVRMLLKCHEQLERVNMLKVLQLSRIY